MFYENIEKTRAWPKISKIMKNKENDYTFWIWLRIRVELGKTWSLANLPRIAQIWEKWWKLVKCDNVALRNWECDGGIPWVDVETWNGDKMSCDLWTHYEMLCVRVVLLVGWCEQVRKTWML